MQTVQSGTTEQGGLGRKAKQTWVLAALAALAVSGALIQSRSEASATSPSRQLKTTVAAPRAKLSGSAVNPAPAAPGPRDR